MLPDVSVGHLQTVNKLLDCNPGVSKDCAKRAFRYFAMIGHSYSPIRSRELPQDDVTSTLAVNLIAESLKSFDNLAPGNDRQLAQPTSTTSSLIGGGTGSPRSSRLSM